MQHETYDLFSYGKLLLTGEFLILKGAKGLSLPVKFGQHMKIIPTKTEQLEWIGLERDGKEWLHVTMKKDLSEILASVPDNAGNEILQILRIVKEMRPELFKRGYKIITKFDFEKNWGLGTSSSLIANLSKWAQINPFALLDKTFNGSGYDVITSLAGKPLVFQRTGIGRVWQFTEFNPPFRKKLYFIHLNKKQPTVPIVNKFKKITPPEKAVQRISEITDAVLHTTDEKEFAALIEEHEQIIGKILRKKPVKERLFADFNGSVKSLGAWGGDMILALGDKKTPSYFKNKGYKTVFRFDELIRNE